MHKHLQPVSEENLILYIISKIESTHENLSEMGTHLKREIRYTLYISQLNTEKNGFFCLKLLKRKLIIIKLSDVEKYVLHSE